MHINSSAFMMAGTETTATLCAGLTYHLSNHPKKMEKRDKLVKETRTSFNSEDEMTITRMERLEYLHAYLDETSRM